MYDIYSVKNPKSINLLNFHVRKDTLCLDTSMHVPDMPNTMIEQSRLERMWLVPVSSLDNRDDKMILKKLTFNSGFTI